MLRSLTPSEKKELLNKIFFYDFNNFNCINGEEIVILLKKELGNTRYCDVTYYNYDKAISKKYYAREKILLKVLACIFNYYKESVFIIRYEDKWIKNKKISPSLHKIFRQHSIDDGVEALQTDDLATIQMICKSILKENMHAFFVLKESQVIVTPTDHMDVFVASVQNTKKTIQNMLKNSFKNNNFILRKV